MITLDITPNNSIEIKGDKATNDTIPNPYDNISFTLFRLAHNPKAIGNIKLDVKGPEATPPASKAIAV